MIVPIVFTFDPAYENLSQTWFFYKMLTICKKEHWPIVAQQQYYEQWDRQHEIFPQFFEKNTCELFDYDVPKLDDFALIDKILIPKEIENKYIYEKGSQSDAYVASVEETWTEMENFMYEILKEYEHKKGEKIEAIISLTYLKFLENVSQKTGIPIIYYEWGPLRYSNYRNTAFFDINGKYRNVEKLYSEFCKEKTEVPILELKEILALFINKDYLKYVVSPEEYEQDKYEIGIVGGYNSITWVTSRINMVELYSLAREQYDEDKIAVRYHPGDPIHAKMNVKNEITGNLIEFLLACKRIVCISSNIEVEAMLYGKTVYDLSDFKYKGIVNNDRRLTSQEKVNKNIINFIMFVCIIPYELLNNVEYIRYRLKNPSLKEIYMYHLKYYLKTFGIPECILNNKNEDRFYQIVLYREFNINCDILEGEEKMKDILIEQLVDEKNKNMELKKQIEELLIDRENEKAELNNWQLKYNSLMNCKSMKITKPLRTIDNFIKGKRG